VILLCEEREKGSLAGGVALCWLVAIIQIVAFVFVNEIHLPCSGKDRPLCKASLYRSLDSVGAFLWIFISVLLLAIPRPPEADQPPTRSALAETKHLSTTQTSRAETDIESDGTETVTTIASSNRSIKSAEKVKAGDCIG